MGEIVVPLNDLDNPVKRFENADVAVLERALQASYESASRTGQGELGGSRTAATFLKLGVMALVIFFTLRLVWTEQNTFRSPESQRLLQEIG